MSNAQNAMTENTALFDEQTAQPMDGLYAKAVEFILTPDETFKRKLDLIEHAEDMTTPQKIEAINQIEDRHITDKVLYTVLALTLIVASTPEGRKVIGSAAKNLAASVAPLYSKVAGKVACCFVFIPLDRRV